MPANHSITNVLSPNSKSFIYQKVDPSLIILDPPMNLAGHNNKSPHGLQIPYALYIRIPTISQIAQC